jgi:hypothetical protein
MRLQYRQVSAAAHMSVAVRNATLIPSSLIAIMLGRFRMTIPDCLHEYKQMGDAIFGNPRHVTRLRTGIVPRVKYDATKMERAAKAVVARRCSKLEHKEKLQVRLPTTYNGIDYVRGACKTFVFPLSTSRCTEEY